MKTTITIELENTEIIHLIGFVAIAEMSSSTFVREAAQSAKVFLSKAINEMPYREFDKAAENFYRQIQVERPKLVNGIANIEFNDLPLFKCPYILK